MLAASVKISTGSMEDDPRAFFPPHSCRVRENKALDFLHPDVQGRPVARCFGQLHLSQEEEKMFARNAHFRLKSVDKAAEFAQTFENEILPLLCKQEGFNGEITLANPGSLEQIATSLWENEDNAEDYNASVYPQVLKILAKVINVTPRIRTFEAVTL